MLEQELKTCIKAQLSPCDIQLQMDGNHCHLVVISDIFKGLNPVKKQQLVYACLNDRIKDGTVHAVHMQTYTFDEWAEHSQ